MDGHLKQENVGDEQPMLNSFFQFLENSDKQEWESVYEISKKLNKIFPFEYTVKSDLKNDDTLVASVPQRLSVRDSIFEHVEHRKFMLIFLQAMEKHLSAIIS